MSTFGIVFFGLIAGMLAFFAFTLERLIMLLRAIRKQNDAALARQQEILEYLRASK